MKGWFSLLYPRPRPNTPSGPTDQEMQAVRPARPPRLLAHGHRILGRERHRCPYRLGQPLPRPPARRPDRRPDPRRQACRRPHPGPRPAGPPTTSSKIRLIASSPRAFTGSGASASVPWPLGTRPSALNQPANAAMPLLWSKEASANTVRQMGGCRRYSETADSLPACQSTILLTDPSASACAMPSESCCRRKSVLFGPSVALPHGRKRWQTSATRDCVQSRGRSGLRKTGSRNPGELTIRTH